MVSNLERALARVKSEWAEAPGAKSVRGGTDWNQDVFKGPLDCNKPYITFYPE